jgi:hypothetical protein
MAELIKIILAKPEWQTKMNDAEIVEKWQAEIVAQGISEHVFKCTLDLLKSYDKISKVQYDEEDDDSFKWCVRLGVSMSELGWKCDCDCSVCVDGHNEGDTEEEDEDDDDEEEEGEGEGEGGVEKEDNENEVKGEGDDDIEKMIGEKVELNDEEKDDDDDGSDDSNDEKGDEKEDENEDGKVARPVTDWAAEYRKRKRNPCKCTVENRIILFQKFVDQFVSRRTFQDMALKRTFLSQISALERSVTTVDYHPGNHTIDPAFLSSFHTLILHVHSFIHSFILSFIHSFLLL